MGPLHGLPVSLKDQFHVTGNGTSMGFVGWIDTFEGKKDPELVKKVDSQVVKELLSLGAVLYCKVSLQVARELLLIDWEDEFAADTAGELPIIPMHAQYFPPYLTSEQIGETLNNIIGTTFNPVNQNLSCGGSSGGTFSTLSVLTHFSNDRV